MKEALVSVILPIYGVEQYLDECIESVVGQTYKNLEIILVDDGSKDQCPQKCDTWAQRDDRIVVLHKHNGGLSDARNAGIEVSKGEYIVFVDSDDVIHFQMVEILLKTAMETQKKMVCCQYKEFCDKVPQSSGIRNWNMRVLSAEDAILESCTNSENHNCFIVAWNRIYHRDLFDDIRYPVGKIHEDVILAYPLLMKSGDIVFVEERLYYYRQRSGSIVNNGFSRKELDIIVGFEERYKYIRDLEDNCCKMRFAVAYLNNIRKCINGLISIGASANEIRAIEQKYYCVYKEVFDLLTFKMKISFFLHMFW